MKLCVLGKLIICSLAVVRRLFVLVHVLLFRLRTSLPSYHGIDASAKEARLGILTARAVDNQCYDSKG